MTRKRRAPRTGAAPQSELWAGAADEPAGPAGPSCPVQPEHDPDNPTRKEARGLRDFLAKAANA